METPATNDEYHPDSRELGNHYNVGDFVARQLPDGGITDVVGVITAVLRKIGFVDVEFPTGNERVSIVEVWKVPKDSIFYAPATLNTSMETWDTSMSRYLDGVNSGYSYAHPRVSSVVSKYMFRTCSPVANFVKRALLAGLSSRQIVDVLGRILPSNSFVEMQELVAFVHGEEFKNELPPLRVNNTVVV